MPVLQFYYTSWNDTARGGQAGLHDRAASPGLSTADLTIVRDLCQYQLPSESEQEPVNAHPVNLRYAILGADKACLVNVRSVGTDDRGRLGNFFAHALVAPVEAFARAAPAFYWDSPFWCARYDEPNTTLPALPALEAKPALNEREVWRFIAEGPREQWLSQLLAAVATSARTRRRVIIVDTPGNVARWVAAVSQLLPAAYRGVLTFSTYVHPRHLDLIVRVPAPGLAPLIMGTPPSAQPRLDPDKYLSFFVLDTRPDARSSEVGESRYARSVAGDIPRAGQAIVPVPVIELYDRIFPRPHAVDANLDAVIYYRDYLDRHDHSLPDENALAAIELALDRLEHEERPDATQAQELERLAATLADAVGRDPSQRPIAELGRTLALLRRAGGDAASAGFRRGLALATDALLHGREDAAPAYWGMLHQAYGDEELVSAVNTASLLADLTAQVGAMSAAQVVSIWRLLCPYLSPSPASGALLAASLARVGAGEDGQSPAVVSPALVALCDITAREAAGWLKHLASEPAQPGIMAYYYALVAKKPLAAREPYRTLFRQSRGDLTAYEVGRDIAAASEDRAIDVLGEWALYLRETANPDAPRCMAAAFTALLARAQGPQGAALARRLLGDDELMRAVDAQSIAPLIDAALFGVSLADDSNQLRALCRTYKSTAGLAPHSAGLIAGILALEGGTLDRGGAAALQSRFARLGEDQYRAEARRLAARFFQPDIAADAPRMLVLALYDDVHLSAFWDVYLSALAAVLAAPDRASVVVSVLDFWFGEAPGVLAASPDAVPEFSRRLPAVCERACRERGYAKAAAALEQLAQSKPWYPRVRDLFQVERRGFFGLWRR